MIQKPIKINTLQMIIFRPIFSLLGHVKSSKLQIETWSVISNYSQFSCLFIFHHSR